MGLGKKSETAGVSRLAAGLIGAFAGMLVGAGLGSIPAWSMLGCVAALLFLEILKRIPSPFQHM